MTTINPRFRIPAPIATQQLVRNGLQVHSATGRGVVDGLNHAYAKQRKLFFCKSVDFTSIPQGLAAANTVWSTYFKTGAAPASSPVLNLVFDMLLMPANNSAAVEPRCYWAVNEVGVGSTNSDELIYGAIETGALTPDHLTRGLIFHAVSPQTEYDVELVVTDYLRPVGCAIYEDPFGAFDDTETYATPLIGGAGEIVTDQQHVDMLTNAHGMFKDNGATLFAWCTDQDPDTGGAAPTRTGTAVNAFDSAVSTWGANSRGFKVQGQYHNPFHTDDVECVFAVRASDTVNGKGDVSLVSTNGTLATISGFTNAAGGEWKTTTFVLDGSTNTDKLDIHIASSTGTVKLYAASAYEETA